MINLKKHKILIFISLIFILTIGCEKLNEDYNSPKYINPIKIGVVGDVAREREVVENIFFAVKMAANEINSNGGLTINGVKREIELVFKNSGGNPDVGENVINELINENINIIIGPTTSAVAVGMADLCIENNILMITYSSTIPELSDLDDQDFIWRTCPSDAFSGIKMAEYSLDSLKFTNGAILYRDDKFGQAMAEVIKNTFESSGGIILATSSYPVEGIDLNRYNFSAELNNIMEQKPQIIFLPVFEQEIGKITQDFWSSSLYQNYEVKPKIFLTEGGFLQELLTNGQPEILETIFGISSSITTTPNYITYKDNYLLSYNFGPISYSEHAYDALYCVAYAMLKTQSENPDDIKQNLRLVTGGLGSSSEAININVNEFDKASTLLLSNVDIDYDGASGQIKFDQNGDPKSKFVVWGIRDGEYTEILYLER